MNIIFILLKNSSIQLSLYLPTQHYSRGFVRFAGRHYRHLLGAKINPNRAHYAMQVD